MPDFYLAFPGGKAKALTLSYDDGVEQDIRLMEIMDQYGLKGTFNLSSALYAPEGIKWPQGQVHRRMTKDEITRLHLHSGHEIAIHCTEHADLAMLPATAVALQVAKDREALEAQFGCIIRGMAYPYGRYNDQVVEALRGCGIAYSRTVISTHQFDLPDDWLRLPATCHHNDPQLMPLARRFAEEKPIFRPWLFYLWGHSYEFEGDQNWHVFEEFAAYIGKRDDIWYATNIQIHDYIEAWRSLITSADGHRIYNPTCIQLFLRHGANIHAIAPGKEIEI